MKTDWFLVANASRARIAQRDARGRFSILATLEHPDSRLHAAQLGPDKAGRELSGRGFGGAAFEPRVDAQRKEHLHFAQELAAAVERDALAGRFEQLHVFASNPFLGLLKQAFGDATRRHLAGAHPVDVTSVGPAELGARIERELQAHAQGEA